MEDRGREGEGERGEVRGFCSPLTIQLYCNTTPGVFGTALLSPMGGRDVCRIFHRGGGSTIGRV